MKNISEEIERIKSLFTEERLYGNLITEAGPGGRFAWVDALLSLVDDATPQNVIKGNKWKNFSSEISNADGLVKAVRKDPAFDEFITKGWGSSITKMTDDILSTGTGALPSKTMLSDGWWKSFKSTLKNNGANLNTRITFDGAEKTLNKHLDDIWKSSSTKQNLDNLQENISQRLSSDVVWKEGSNVEEAFKDLKDNYVDEIALFKTADDGTDIVDDVVKHVDDMKSVRGVDTKELDDLLAADEKMSLIKSKEKGKKIIRDIAEETNEWSEKYAEAFTTIVAKVGIKYVFTSKNKICRILGKMKAIDGIDSDRIFRMTSPDGLMPFLNIRTMSDIAGLWPGRALHKVITKSSKYKTPWNKASLLYKTTIMGSVVAMETKLGYGLFNLGKYIIQKLPGAQSLLFNIHKPKVLIWRLDGFTKVSECYELKYSKDISTIEQNSMAYENGDGYLWNDDEFDVLDSMKINGMGKGEYQDFIKYQRGLDTNKPVVDDSGKVVREWLPDDFCDYFICKDGEPVRVSCARYEPGGNLVDEGIQEQSIRYTDEWIVNANQAIDSTKSTFNDIGLKGEEISGKIKEKTKLSDEDKAEIDKMIENLSEGELNEILKQVRDQSVKSKNNIINNNNTAVEVVQGIGD
jgi:hypothetical protein